MKTLKKLTAATLIAAVTMAVHGIPALADQIILDDLIVDGNSCIGLDCINNEAFGEDILRLKENNLRINFRDTSDPDITTGNDWRITANDSSSGGRNRFSIDDMSADPFTGVSGIDIASDANATTTVAMADINGDFFPDLVVGNYEQPTRLYLNNGTADPFNGVTGIDITADSHATTSIALADLNLDSRMDIVVGNYNQPNRLYLNNGTADPFNGVTGIDITSDANATTAVALADINGDSRIDLVAGNDRQPNRLYLNNGTADPFNGVTGTDITADSQTTTSVALADINGDYRIDLVAGNDSLPNRLYLNNGTADPFNGVTGIDIASDADATTAVALADTNGDLLPDLVSGNYGQSNRLYLNNGTADPFNGVTGIDIGRDVSTTTALELIDINGDNSLDLLVGNYNQPNRLYLNNGSANPFRIVTGTDISQDSNATTAITAAYIQPFGQSSVLFTHLVAGNLDEANRLYLIGNSSVLTIEARAPDASLYVDGAGRAGIGTSTPDTGAALDVRGNLIVEGDIEITGGARSGSVRAKAFRRGKAKVTFAEPYRQDYVILLTAVAKRAGAQFKPTVLAKGADGFKFTCGGDINDLRKVFWTTRVTGEY